MRLPVPRPLQSLAARIGVFVFAATLISALAVASTSAYALRAFLRSKLEQKIPASVTQLRDRLDLWYAQRSFDVEVFAKSETVVDGALAARARAGRARARRGGAVPALRAPEPPAVLGHLRARRRGRGVGRRRLAARALASAAARARGRSPRRASRACSARATARVSRPSRARSVARSGRLPRSMPLLPVEGVAEQLASGVQAGVARALLYAEDGRFLLASIDFESLPAGISPELRTARPDEVSDYVAADGLHVVASRLPFPRLGWILVVEEDYDTAFAPIASILGRTLTLNLGIVAVLSGLAFAFAGYVVRPLRTLSEVAHPAARRRGGRAPAGRHGRRRGRHPHAQLRSDGREPRPRALEPRAARDHGRPHQDPQPPLLPGSAPRGGREAASATALRWRSCWWTSTTSRR